MKIFFIIFAMLNTCIVNHKELNHSPKANVISPNGAGIKPFVVGDNLFNMETEVWKEIENYEGLYQVSNFERVKLLSHNDAIGRNKKEVFLSFFLDKSTGYLFFRIGNRKKYIHRILALSFIPNPENKPCVNHKNGIKTDNRIENLEWVTYSENNKHAYDNGLKVGSKGELNPNHKKVIQCDLNGNIIKVWSGVRFVARELNVNYQSICAVCNGRQKTAHGFKWQYQ